MRRCGCSLLGENLVALRFRIGRAWRNRVPRVGRLHVGRRGRRPHARRERQHAEHLEILPEQAIDLRVGLRERELSRLRLHVLPFHRPVAHPNQTRLAAQREQLRPAEGVVQAEPRVRERVNRDRRQPQAPPLDRWFRWSASRAAARNRAGGATAESRRVNSCDDPAGTVIDLASRHILPIVEWSVITG